MLLAALRRNAPDILEIDVLRFRLTHPKLAAGHRGDQVRVGGLLELVGSSGGGAGGAGTKEGGHPEGTRPLFVDYQNTVRTDR